MQDEIPEQASAACAHPATVIGEPVRDVPPAHTAHTAESLESEAHSKERKIEPETESASTAAAMTPVHAKLAVTVEELSPTIRLEQKHLRAIRWMHWINFPVLFVMIWSGLLIYWNDSIPAQGYAHQVYRVGIGNVTLFRLFPDWFYNLIHAPFRVTTGLGLHFLFMWFFAINGLLYVLYLAISREWKFVVPDRRSIQEAIQVTLVDLHIRQGLPPQKKYNGAQKIAYTLVILMGAGSLVTGLAIYKPAQLHLLTTLLGGYEMARWEHFWLTIGFCGFFVIHVAQVAMAGWNNLRSMVSGYEIKRVDEPSLERERRTW